MAPAASRSSTTEAGIAKGNPFADSLAERLPMNRVLFEPKKAELAEQAVNVAKARVAMMGTVFIVFFRRTEFECVGHE
jgi:hypothetical protein